MGISKANEREPQSCSVRVFNFKLGCYVVVHGLLGIQTFPHLKIQTRPRFCPVRAIFCPWSHCHNHFSFVIGSRQNKLERFITWQDKPSNSAAMGIAYTNYHLTTISWVGSCLYTQEKTLQGTNALLYLCQRNIT